ncbi:MAG: hypothetical protein OXG36_14985 [Caldilineaceae bacterium]|nr:hypothetical protein [Caldilineaceae bacterium]
MPEYCTTHLSQLIKMINDTFQTDNIPCQLTQFTFQELYLTNTKPSESSDVGPIDKCANFTVESWSQIYIVDNEVVYQEAVKPALNILNKPDYLPADQEFRAALMHYRQGNFADCIVRCNCALESVLKIVCKKNGLRISNNEHLAWKLVDELVEKLNMDNAFKSHLKITLNIRNKHGAHGSSSLKIVTRHLAQYVLANAASSIVLVVSEADILT